jgi:branched-chain amino acid aminotransferase
LNENGLVLGLATGLQKSTDALANLKSCNALIYAIAARQARENQWNDALILNTAGNIIESTIANIFWITDDIIYTPPLADGCIAGVMRRHLLSNNSIVERSLTLPTLLEADEVFLTNAIKQVRWVGMMDKRKYGNSRAKELFKLAGA